MPNIRIIHISDLHLTYNKKPIWGVDTYKNFITAIEKIKRIANVNCIVVTGDIANDGKAETYKYTDMLFKTTNIPTFWCPGNHDNINDFYNLPINFCQVEHRLKISGFKILFLNSIVPDPKGSTRNRAIGYISNSDIERLKEELSNTDKPVIVAMHHPPLEIVGWLGIKDLINKEIFNSIVLSHNVRLVMYGHIHYFTLSKLNDTTYTSASSIGFAFDKDLPKFVIARGNEGFSVIDITDSDIKIKNNTII